ncbi:glycoside hydrolase superfamily [Phyllosticta citriasiana]|uniref:glycoside hydrolase superfamily n=1 Tax=Phyllosticta citriasiana TaxID=595635 RepID=UPI0030FD6E16
MKAGIFSTLVFFLGLSAAQPHRQHRHFHNERRALVTEVEIVTVTAPLVVVEVSGTETFTFTENVPQIPAPTSTIEMLPPPPPPPPPPTSSPEPPTAPPSIPQPPIVVPPPAPTSSEPPLAPPAPPPPAPTTLSTQAARPPPPVNVPEPTATAPEPSLVPAPTFPPGPVNNGYGISYNPYNHDGTCKDKNSVDRDVDTLKDYGLMRIYGVDCEQLNTVLPAVQRYDGMKLFLGIHNVNSAASEAQQIVDAVKKYFGDWNRIDTVSVGNEAVRTGAATIGQVIAGIRAARGVLNGGGYTGPVVAVDTIDTYLNSDGSGIQLCKESDYNAANCHAFFDNSGYFNKGSDAGRFVTMQVERFKQGCGNRRTVITESGWPHSSSWPLSAFGNTPVPDEENHIAAIASLKEAFVGNRSDLVLFSAFNDMWKQDNEGTKGTEKWWGLLDGNQ